MGNFNKRGGKSGGGSSRGFNSGRKFGGRPEMHKAVCNDCGNDCHVPFKPTGSKPVLCNNCFGGRDSRGGRSDRSGGGRRERPRFEDKQMHDAVCDKCKRDCQVPFRPTNSKPVFCNDCFGGKDSRGGKSDRSNDGRSNNSNDTIKQIRILNDKIDTLIKMLVSDPEIEKEEKSKTVKKEKVGKPKTEKKEEIEKKPKTKTKTTAKKSSTKKKK